MKTIVGDFPSVAIDLPFYVTEAMTLKNLQFRQIFHFFFTFLEIFENFSIFLMFNMLLMAPEKINVMQDLNNCCLCYLKDDDLKIPKNFYE